MDPIAAGELPWYNIIALVMLAGLFLYFAMAAASFPPTARKKLPAFVFNQKICYFIAIVFFVMSLGKFMGKF
ncbi:MAG: putative membrane protein [Janthinobacterium sp.]|jgi:uncharacterized membrane protein